MRRALLIITCLVFSLISCNDGSGSGSSDPVMNTYYLDADGDGYGDPDQSTQASECPAGYVEDNTDCVDYRADLNPGAGTCILQTFYRDMDRDGYGNPDDPVQAYVCPSDCVVDNTDCDDDQADINPSKGNCP